MINTNLVNKEKNRNKNGDSVKKKLGKKEKIERKT